MRLQGKDDSMRTKELYEFTCLCGALVQSEERLTTCPKCGRLIQLDWGDSDHAKASQASWHAALYALILKSQGVDRDEICRRIRRRYRNPKVLAQVLWPGMRRTKRYAFAD